METRHTTRRRTRTLWLMLCAAIICACVFALPASAANVEKTHVPLDVKNWMRYLPNDMPISEINMPGTHDSGTTHIDLHNWARCQALDLKDQMGMGMRVFDIRLVIRRFTTSDKAEDLIVTHGNCWAYTGSGHSTYLRLSHCISYAKDFLKDHPDEVIVFNICAEDEKEKTKPIIYDYILHNQYADHPDAKVVTFMSGREVPRLGDVRGKVVIISDDDEKTYTKYEMEYQLDKDLDGKIQKKVDRINRIFTTPYQNNWRIDYLGIDRQKWPTFYRDEKAYNEPGREANSDVKYIGTNITNKDDDSKHWFGSGPYWCAEQFYKNDGIKNIIIPSGYRYGWITMDFPEMDKNFTNKIILSNYDLWDVNFEIVYPEGLSPEGDFVPHLKWTDAKTGKTTTRKKLNTQPKQKKTEGGYVTESILVPITAVRSNYHYYADVPQIPKYYVTVEKIYRPYSDFTAGKDMGSKGVYTVRYTYMHEPNNGDLTVMIDWTACKDTSYRSWTFEDFMQRTKDGIPVSYRDSQGGQYSFTVSDTQPGIGSWVEPVYGADTWTDTKWTMIIHNVPVFDVDDERLVYQVGEPGTVLVSPYICITTKNPAPYTFTIVMSYDTRARNIQVPIVWMDDNDAYDTRAQAVTELAASDFVQTARGMTAYSDAGEINVESPVPHQVDEQNISYSFNDFYPDGVVTQRFITTDDLTRYRVENSDRTYISFSSRKVALNSPVSMILQADLDVNVIWDDDGNADGRRPTKLEFSLKDPAYAASVIGESSGTADPDRWSCSFAMDAIELVSGRGYSFTVGDVTKPQSYTLEYTMEKLDGAPHYVLNITCHYTQTYEEITGNVNWIDGGLPIVHRAGTEPVPNPTVYRTYLPDPDGDAVTEKVETDPSLWVWNDDLTEYSYSDKKFFPALDPETGIEYTYSIEAPKLPGYMDETAIMLDMSYTRAVQISGRVDWKDQRLTYEQPTVQLLRDGEPVGEPVQTTDFLYCFDDLPVSDADSIPYAYTIEATLPGYRYFMDYQDPVRDTSGGETAGFITQNVLIYPLVDPVAVDIPVRLLLVDKQGEPVDTTREPDTFTFVMAGLPDLEIEEQTLELSRENGFSGAFHFTFDPRGAKQFTVSITQKVARFNPSWTYDTHTGTAKITLVYGETAMALVDPADGSEVLFRNVYSPTGAVASIDLVKQIDNKVAGMAEVPDRTFRFRLERVYPDNTRVPVDYVSGVGARSLRFSRIPYDTAGEYRYIVSELV